jgi:hypothetical protein
MGRRAPPPNEITVITFLGAEFRISVVNTTTYNVRNTVIGSRPADGILKNVIEQQRWRRQKRRQAPSVRTDRHRTPLNRIIF